MNERNLGEKGEAIAGQFGQKDQGKNIHERTKERMLALADKIKRCIDNREPITRIVYMREQKWEEMSKFELLDLAGKTTEQHWRQDPETFRKVADLLVQKAEKK